MERSDEIMNAAVAYEDSIASQDYVPADIIDAVIYGANYADTHPNPSLMKLWLSKACQYLESWYNKWKINMSDIAEFKKHMEQQQITYTPFTARDQGYVDEIITALRHQGEEKMISYDLEISWLNNLKYRM